MARRDWQGCAETLPARKVVVVDESGTHLDMARRYGRAPRGQRVYVKQRRSYGKNMTLLAGLTLNGMTDSLVVEGAVTTPVFEAFIEQVLLPCNPVILWLWITWLLTNPAMSNSSCSNTAAVFYSCQPIRQISRPLNKLFPKLNSTCEPYALKLLRRSSMLLPMPLPLSRHSMPSASSLLLVFSFLTNTSTCPRTALEQVLKISEYYGQLRLCRVYGDWNKSPLSAWREKNRCP